MGRPIIAEVPMEKAHQLAAMVGHNQRKKTLYLWKDGEQTKAWCSICQHTDTITKETAQDISAAHICPFCFRPLDRIRKSDNETGEVYVQDGSNGYHLRYRMERGELKVTGCDHVAAWDGNKEYVRAIIKTMNGCIGRMANNGWRQVRTTYYGYHTYEPMFWPLRVLQDGDIAWTVDSKKEYYRRMAIGLNLKSDQIKFISQGLYCQNQLAYIAEFDLHSRKDVLKYRRYMKQHPADAEHTYNKATLDYLYRNGIHLSDYNDYVDNCRKINRKPDKPKDFKHWHDEVIKAVRIKENEQTSRKIQKRAETLKGMETKEKQIRPIKDYPELMVVGQTLHNCIRTYAERYAEGKCDLFCLIVKGEMVGAIEVAKNELVQARGDHNEQLPADYNRFVKKWFTEQYGGTIW